jgi:DNA mismatch repair ATPase MutS
MLENSKDNKKIVILSAFYQKHKLGIACFDSIENELGYCQVLEGDDLSLFQMFINEYKPSVILIPTNSNEHIIEILKSHLESFEYRVVMMKPNFFSDEVAKRNISMLRARNTSFNNNVGNCFGYVTNLSLLFDFTEQEVIKSIGALLSYLFKYPISGLEVNVSDGIIYVDYLVNISLFVCFSVF